jgi:cytochrome c5
LNKPIAGAEQSERVTLERIQKVGTVEILDANRVMKTGEEVFKAQCATCHAAGLAGAPKLGDAAVWGPRIKTGYETLLNSALKGKNAMGAQGGGNFDDYEIARAVVYMANGSGAKFAEPAQPAAPVAPAQ